MASDDLLALTAGELDFTRAWASGRVKMEASIRDMLKLRSLL
jgi:putative sterol carrier protein